MVESVPSIWASCFSSRFFLFNAFIAPLERIKSTIRDIFSSLFVYYQRKLRESDRGRVAVSAEQLFIAFI